jgi:hypothetical protein
MPQPPAQHTLATVNDLVMEGKVRGAGRRSLLAHICVWQPSPPHACLLATMPMHTGRDGGEVISDEPPDIFMLLACEARTRLQRAGMLQMECNFTLLSGI